MCVIVFYKSPFFDTDTFILSQTPTTFRKTEIAAVAAATKCFSAGKVCLRSPRMSRRPRRKTSDTDFRDRFQRKPYATDIW